MLFQASSQAPNLSDAIYLYGLALNRTLTANGESGIKNASAIVENSKGEFLGIQKLPI